jgi:OOP family OmpA-OmpF porin
MKKLFLLTAVSILASAPVQAAEEGFYIFGTVGQSRADVKKSDFLEEEYPGIHTSLDKTDTGYKLQVGYRFNDYVAVEGGYVDLGKMKFSLSSPIGGIKAESKASGINLAAVGFMPLDPSFSVFAKAGIINAKVKMKASSSVIGETFNESGSERSTRPMFGLGAVYSLSKTVDLRVEYEWFNKLRFDDSKTNVDMISAGVAIKF